MISNEGSLLAILSYFLLLKELTDVLVALG